MKNQVKIISLVGLIFLVYLFPFSFVDAAKLESGVTINAPSTTQTETVCDDNTDNDNDGNVDANDEDCAAAPAGPTAGTCGLEIVSGVPINYGQLNIGQESAEQQVWVSNVGTVGANIMIKGGNWVSDAAPPTYFSSEMTHVSRAGNIPWGNKDALKSTEFELGQIPSQHQVLVFFQLMVPASDALSGFTGSLHQEVTMNLIC